jgi:Dna[CI] antecedent, DciA
VDKLGNILPRVLAVQPGSEQLAELRVRAAFRTLLGEGLADACEEVTLQAGTLCVTTTNPALAHQLRDDGGRLLERLNQEGQLPRRVRRLRVRTGSWRG